MAWRAASDTFVREFRARGHRVIVVAPEFAEKPADETDVIRVPAIQNFNGSDFSVRLPVPGYVQAQLADFKPDIVHAHHPFLLGENALRVAASANVPLVFTHHTMYEQYTHYVPGDSPAMQRFVVQLTTDYANLCDRVFAPSESVAAMLRNRGVIAPIEVVPTGVDINAFARGDGRALRRTLGIPDRDFVVGHVGRLAKEKNLDFLADAVSRFLKHRPDAHFLVAGAGPAEDDIRKIFDHRHLARRLHLLGAKAVRSWSTHTTRWTCLLSRRRAKHKAWSSSKRWPLASLSWQSMLQACARLSPMAATDGFWHTPAAASSSRRSTQSPAHPPLNEQSSNRPRAKPPNILHASLCR